MRRALVLLVLALVFSGAGLRATVKGLPDRQPAPGASARPTAPATAEAPVTAAAPASREAGQAAHARPHEDLAAARELDRAAGEVEGGESPWATVARLFNFALLAAILVYLLRSPFAAFLEGRRQQIRKHLADAAEMKKTAAQQLAEIDRRLRGLPAELEALKQRGAQEIVAEETRIREAAETERQRMLEGARREMDRRAQTAERRLVQATADLAVRVATERVRHRMTDEDQRRLVDRYLERVRPEAIGS